MAGDLAASVAVSSSTAASRRSAGTTWFTKPMRSASTAATLLPVSMSSSAFLGGIARTSGTVIMYGQRPTLISGVPNWLSSEQTTKSHDRASPKPPASANPRTRATVGFPRDHSSSKSSAS